MSKAEWADKDYYADLGVSSSATHDEIRKAYRTLARDNHPDKNPGDAAAEERFKKAAEAYDVIGDDKKRAEYDELKAMIAQGGFGRFGGAATGGFRGQDGFNISDLSDLFGGSGPGGGFSAEGGLGDIFGGMWGGGGGSSRRQARPRRGSDVETDVTLDFREAVLGTQLSLQIKGNAPCKTCHGSGSTSGNPTTCGTCHGSGFVNENRGAFGFSAPCSDCNGSGRVVTDPCADCRGTGVQNRDRTINVKIPPGMNDGQKVRLAGRGEAGPNGAPSGDVLVTVHVRPDKLFERKNDNLLLTVPVSFEELALGTTLSVPTLNGRVKVKVPAGTNDGRVLRVKGKGVPRRKGAAGDLLVKLAVQVPSSLDDAAKQALQAYADAVAAQGVDPRDGWAGA